MQPRCSEPGQRGGADGCKAKHSKPKVASQSASEEVRPRLVRHVPDRVHRIDGRLSETLRAVNRAKRANDDREHAALQRVRVALQLRADDREVAERTREKSMLDGGMAAQHETQHRRHQQQEGEEREQAVVGDQHCLATGLIVAVFLHDRDRDRQHRVPLLEPVEAPEAPLDHVHRCFPSSVDDNCRSLYPQLSTNPRSGRKTNEGQRTSRCPSRYSWGERRGSNPRPPGPQPGALPAELRPPRLGQCSRITTSGSLAVRPPAPASAARAGVVGTDRGGDLPSGRGVGPGLRHEQRLAVVAQLVDALADVGQRPVAALLGRGWRSRPAGTSAGRAP